MARLDPAAITLAPGYEPFTLRPVIKDMLRLRRCSPGSLLIVEGIDVLSVSESGEFQAIRLLLGDGQLCVQALLHPDRFHMVDRKEVYVGCYVQVDDFILRLEEAVDDVGGEEEGARGMTYLIVNELETVGWNETYVAMWKHDQKGKGIEKPLHMEGSLITKENDIKNDKEEEEEEMNKAQIPGQSPQGPSVKASASKDGDVDMEDAFKTSEAFAFPSSKPTTTKPTPPTSVPVPASASASASTSTVHQPIALPRDWHNHQVPLKLTTLRSIPHLPYAQNWSVNVLAIIVSLSPVEPSHLPPGKQRTARIADPSTAKQVHLTVFLDADEFSPQVGSAVLLTGVKNHRFDGGSLKKYASDGKSGMNGGSRWWFEEPWEMGWLDIKGMKEWWAEMEAYDGQNGSDVMQ